MTGLKKTAAVIGHRLSSKDNKVLNPKRKPPYRPESRLAKKHTAFTTYSS